MSFEVLFDSQSPDRPFCEYDGMSPPALICCRTYDYDWPISLW